MRFQIDKAKMLSPTSQNFDLEFIEDQLDVANISMETLSSYIINDSNADLDGNFEMTCLDDSNASTIFNFQNGKLFMKFE